MFIASLKFFNNFHESRFKTKMLRKTPLWKALGILKLGLIATENPIPQLRSLFFNRKFKYSTKYLSDNFFEGDHKKYGLYMQVFISIQLIYFLLYIIYCTYPESFIVNACNLWANFNIRLLHESSKFLYYLSKKKIMSPSKSFMSNMYRHNGTHLQIQYV
jgi:hypothetical protein